MAAFSRAIWAHGGSSNDLSYIAEHLEQSGATPKAKMICK